MTLADAYDLAQKTAYLQQHGRPPKTADDLVARYLALRDHLAASNKRFAEFCAPFKAEMDAIAMQLMEKLNAEGSNAGKTPHGTYYKSVIVTPKIVDREKYLLAVMNNYHSFGQGMLQLAAPKKEAIDEYMQDNDGTLPPGVETTSYVHVNVRKS
jgi:hypothetical protein